MLLHPWQHKKGTTERGDDWEKLAVSLRWLTTVLMEYKATTFNSFKKGSKLFFPSLFIVCLSLLRFYVKFEQLNVNK